MQEVEIQEIQKTLGGLSKRCKKKEELVMSDDFREIFRKDKVTATQPALHADLTAFSDS